MFRPAAARYDTSVQIIEAHDSKFIGEHSDDRRGLLADEPAAGNVVALPKR